MLAECGSFDLKLIHKERKQLNSDFNLNLIISSSFFHILFVGKRVTHTSSGYSCPNWFNDLSSDSNEKWKFEDTNKTIM